MYRGLSDSHRETKEAKELKSLNTLQVSFRKSLFVSFSKTGTHFRQTFAFPSFLHESRTQPISGVDVERVFRFRKQNDDVWRRQIRVALSHFVCLQQQLFVAWRRRPSDDVQRQSERRESVATSVADAGFPSAGRFQSKRLPHFERQSRSFADGRVKQRLFQTVFRFRQLVHVRPTGTQRRVFVAELRTTKAGLAQVSVESEFVEESEGLIEGWLTVFLLY